MFKLFENWQKKRERQRLLLEFYAELKKNLESYYVMDQIGRFRLFRMESWSKLEKMSFLPLDEAMAVYIRRLEEYNSLLDDFLKYEQWYASDINNKTASSAKTLHDKREEPRNKFQGLEPVIRSAVQDFEKQLRAEKVIS